MKSFEIDRIMSSHLSDYEKKVSLVELKSRRTGSTTRHIDAIVQHLFEHGKVSVNTSYSTHLEADRIFKLVCRRLQTEHNHEDFKFDVRRREIIWLFFDKFCADQRLIQSHILELQKKMPNVKP